MFACLYCSGVVDWIWVFFFVTNLASVLYTCIFMYMYIHADTQSLLHNAVDLDRVGQRKCVCTGYVMTTEETSLAI